MTHLIASSLVVFAITLIWTKSRVLASKREFVKQQYEAAKLFEKPHIIHTWWHALWTCPMCSGWWVAMIICLFFTEFNYIYDALIVFGLNWLWHCLESVLFFGGKFLEIFTSEEEIFDKNIKKMYNKKEGEK